MGSEHLSSFLTGALVPYNGLRVCEHFGCGQGSHSISSYGMDQSRTKRYAFNSLGFRGEEPLANAAMYVFVCGCSYTFGTGLNIQETWAYKLKQRLAQNICVDPVKVNLLNFSQGGASNCYISRVLISQTARFRPGLVIALFTHKNRFELYGREKVAHVQASCTHQYEGTEWAERVQHKWLSISEDDIAMLYVRNILLLQSHCKARMIPFMFGSVESMLDAAFFDRIQTPVNAPFLSAVDFNLLVPLQKWMWLDRAADYSHPGPKSQDAFCATFWETYKRLYLNLNNVSRKCGKSVRRSSHT